MGKIIITILEVKSMSGKLTQITQLLKDQANIYFNSKTSVFLCTRFYKQGIGLWSGKEKP